MPEEHLSEGVPERDDEPAVARFEPSVADPVVESFAEPADSGAAVEIGIIDTGRTPLPLATRRELGSAEPAMSDPSLAEAVRCAAEEQRA